MPRNIMMRLVWLFLICLGVGLVLSALDIHPSNILTRLEQILTDLWQYCAHFFGWAWDYVWLGALVVLPIWGILLVMKAFKRRSSS